MKLSNYLFDTEEFLEELDFEDDPKPFIRKMKKEEKYKEKYKEDRQKIRNAKRSQENME